MQGYAVQHQPFCTNLFSTPDISRSFYLITLKGFSQIDPNTNDLRYAPCLSDAATRSKLAFGIKNFAHGADTGFMQMPLQ